MGVSKRVLRHTRRMPFSDASYLAAIGLAGAAARALRRRLPSGWRMRLEAEPPKGVSNGSWVWVHAVSVGELLLSEGLIVRLRNAKHRVHVSTGTEAGWLLLQDRLDRWNVGTGLISGGAFPLDDPAGLRSFFEHPPACFIALETELWPNLIRELARRDIPRIVVNGRLTRRSLSKGGPWMRAAARRLSLVVARDEDSFNAFRQLGAPKVALGGNLKADLPAPPPLHVGWSALRSSWEKVPVLVAGNSVDGEETLILSAWKAAQSHFPTLKLILAPRQAKRFDAVAQILRNEGCVFRRASEPWPEFETAWTDVSILLLDTLGELAAAYALGSLALVGGGWRAQGGHNPIEPLRFGVPTLIGPGFSNFEDLVQPLREADALRVVNAETLSHAVIETLQTCPRHSDGHPHPALQGLLGALDRTWNLLEPFLPLR
jgi:3-deoxy-D-manno-octulosonic-acid transferase